MCYKLCNIDYNVNLETEFFSSICFIHFSRSIWSSRRCLGSSYIKLIFICYLLYYFIYKNNSALHENLFSDKKEAAFSVMFCGDFAGYLIVYLYASAIRTRIAIILQIIYLTIAIIGYSIIQIKQNYKRFKRSSNILINMNDIDNQ